ncbi:LysR family transcriptional regulator [Effusibacillus dendaii]|uniref:LysR family transcriptional regulator n=1 Tax=Effusibacillus dendaii TaxID=2743772 RepID=A0A7I8D6C9_9BACL|nr:LysR family transcriptional regulator [Effusibacillus dendaii]BCJ85684.1 LysR family transcriptional regulator [Effusibacillus dendaii]
MELHQLQYVLSVEKFKSFSQAADEINMSQSTLSQQIKKLEDELGTKIFERTTRSVLLTPAGLEFIVYAKRILGEVERARLAMLEYNSLKRGSIVIGTIPIIGYLGLTSLIASFQKMYPGIQIQFREAGSDVLIKLLLSSEIDVAVLTYPHSQNYESAIDFYPLFDDEVVLITNVSHPLAKRKQIDLAEASKENFIFIKSSYGMRQICLQACREAGFEPNITYESSHVETICGLVEDGLGVALLTSRVVEYVSRPYLARIRLKKSNKRTTAIAIHRDPHPSITVVAFRDFTLKWIREKFERESNKKK